MDIKFDEEDISFFSAINKEIDELTDKEVLLQHKTSQNIDAKAIREKKEKEFFNNIKVQLENFITHCVPLRELLKEDNVQIYEKLRNTALDQETLIKKLSDYNSLKELKNEYKHILTPEEIKKLAEIGDSYFNRKDFDKAHLYFLFLSALDPLNADNYLSKGMAEQNMKRYDEAFQSYFMAITLDQTQLLPYLQIIDCLILSHKLEEAKQVYSVIEKEVHPSEYADDPFYVSKVKAIKHHLAKIT